MATMMQKLWADHLARRHVVGDWTVVNLLAWGVIYALIMGAAGLVGWAAS
jgi:hypothetical protein